MLVICRSRRADLRRMAHSAWNQTLRPATVARALLLLLRLMLLILLLLLMLLILLLLLTLPLMCVMPS